MWSEDEQPNAVLFSGSDASSVRRAARGSGGGATTVVPGTPQPTPYALPLHPTPYTLHPTPYTLHPTPFTLHPTPYTPFYRSTPGSSVITKKEKHEKDCSQWHDEVPNPGPAVPGTVKGVERHLQRTRSDRKTYVTGTMGFGTLVDGCCASFRGMRLSR